VPGRRSSKSVGKVQDTERGDCVGHEARSAVEQHGERVERNDIKSRGSRFGKPHTATHAQRFKQSSRIHASWSVSVHERSVRREEKELVHLMSNERQDGVSVEAKGSHVLSLRRFVAILFSSATKIETSGMGEEGLVVSTSLREEGRYDEEEHDSANEERGTGRQLPQTVWLDLCSDAL